MKTLLFTLAAALSLLILPARSDAFYPFGYYARGNWIAPYPYNPYVPPVPAVGGYGAYSSPYGYSSYYNYGTVPTLNGYQSYYNYGTTVRPYAVGPFHSVYFDPFANTYRYGSGPLNTPSSFGYFYSNYPY